MKSLNIYIQESLLGGFEDIEASMDPIEEIRQFIKDNYRTNGRIKISDEPNENGEYEVNCDGYVHAKVGITSLTNGMFKWGVVKKDFDCDYCNSLKNLKGAPEKVGCSFKCNDCKSLISLEGAPKEVGQNFDCSYCNSLTSLEGSPEKVGWTFSCTDCNSLTSLEGAPKEVDRSFNCSWCESLVSLKGAPKYIGGHFDCSYCKARWEIKEIVKISKVLGNIYV